MIDQIEELLFARLNEAYPPSLRGRPALPSLLPTPGQPTLSPAEMSEYRKLWHFLVSTGRSCTGDAQLIHDYAVAACSDRWEFCHALEDFWFAREAVKPPPRKILFNLWTTEEDHAKPRPMVEARKRASFRIAALVSKLARRKKESL